MNFLRNIFGGAERRRQEQEYAEYTAQKQQQEQEYASAFQEISSLINAVQNNQAKPEDEQQLDLLLHAFVRGQTRMWGNIAGNRHAMEQPSIVLAQQLHWLTSHPRLGAVANESLVALSSHYDAATMALPDHGKLYRDQLAQIPRAWKAEGEQALAMIRTSKRFQKN